MKFNATVDVIEDGIVTLMPTNNERSPITMPIGLLPKGIREGQILSFCLEHDQAATADADKRAEWLLGQMQTRGKNRR